MSAQKVRARCQGQSEAELLTPSASDRALFKIEKILIKHTKIDCHR